jgi:HEAT repeat protein
LKEPSPKRKPRFSEEIIRDCLRVLESGDPDSLFEIIPRLGVIRDPRFSEHLLTLLWHDDAKKREFAAYAMGAIGSHEFLEPLKKAYAEAEQAREFGGDECIQAVIEAVGAIGDDAAVDFFLPILKSQPEGKKGSGKLRKWIVESLGTIAQQGGDRSLQALLELTYHKDPDTRALTLSELAVAYWHRPNEIADSTLKRIHELMDDRTPIVAESALAALQSLADVGCRRAESLFAAKARK